MKIIIGASKNNKIGSRLISWWMNAPYSHVYIRWHLNTQDRDVVYHAAHGMVHFREFNKFSKENTTTREFVLNITDEQFQKLSQKCIDLSGEKYPPVELFQIFISDITKGRVKFKDQKGYICSELLSILLFDLGVLFTKPSFLMRPDDIIKGLEKISIPRMRGKS